MTGKSVPIGDNIEDASPTQVGSDVRHWGYAVVRNVLDPHEVAELRALLQERQFGEEMTASEFLGTPQLAELPWRPRVVRALRGVLGARYVLYPNLTVRRERYVGWHIDAGMSGRSEQLFAPDFRHLGCAIYLQDNRRGEGGGLDVRPGSHLIPFGLPPRWYVSHAVRSVRRLFIRPRMVESRAGDLVMWDGRLVHRSTAPGPGGGSKLGIFWSAARPGPQNRQFMLHLVSRMVADTGFGRSFNPRYRDLACLTYPDTFPSSFVEAAVTNEITVASVADLLTT